jgi:hypothetical protein
VLHVIDFAGQLWIIDAIVEIQNVVGRDANRPFRGRLHVALTEAVLHAGRSICFFSPGGVRR